MDKPMAMEVTMTERELPFEESKCTHCTRGFGTDTLSKQLLIYEGFLVQGKGNGVSADLQ